ncbi:MAG: VOC family protein [Myxococcota bacterium]
MSVQRLSHLGLCVADLDRAKHFWCEGLGFAEVGAIRVAGEPSASLLELPDVELDAVYLERDGVRLELLHYPAPGHVGSPEARPMNALGLTHLSFRVEDVGQTAAALVELGAHERPGTRVGNPEFAAGAMFLTCPDGSRIELVSMPGDPDRLPGQTA